MGCGLRTTITISPSWIKCNGLSDGERPECSSLGDGRKSPHSHAQTARNLRRSLRKVAAGARLIQAEGLDSKSAADVAASLADALEELHRLQRCLDRRIRRDS